ncbi:MAG: metal-sensing transcriptional repressor [Burkholderiaceae bacterium]|nr:metal-sensing transcriptional repressor [Burkholderiaceae bacterium]
MSALTNDLARDDISKRLRRIEGQIRGVIRMVEGGEQCESVAQQLSAARKAIDAVFARMTVCYLQQELGEGNDQADPHLDKVLEDVGLLLRRLT